MGRTINLFGEELGGYICQIRWNPLLEGCVATSFPQRPICTIESWLRRACVKRVVGGRNQWPCIPRLWTCSRGMELSSITFETEGVLYREFVDLIWYLMFVQHVRDEVLEMVFMIVWCMWYNRNAVRHGSSCQSAQHIIQKAQMLIVEF